MQTAVGTHRLGVAQILAQLTSAGALILDEAVAKTGMVPKLVQLCFAHQGNNALHSTVASLLRYPSPACNRPHGLLQPELLVSGSEHSVTLSPCSCQEPLHTYCA